MRKNMSVGELDNSFPLGISEIDDFGLRMNISPAVDESEKVKVAFESVVSDFTEAIVRTRDSDALDVALCVEEFRELFLSLTVPERKFVAWFVQVLLSEGADYALRCIECFSWFSYVGHWNNVDGLLRNISIEKMYRDCERVSQIVRDREVAAV